MSGWDGVTEALREQEIADLRARLAAIKALCESASRQGAPYSVDCDDVLALIGDDA